MPLNDGDDGNEFSSSLEDEDIFDAHPRPGIEMLGAAFDLEVDRGSGSFAEDGRLEVAEDRVMNDGESQLGSAAMYGPTEIGFHDDEFEGVDRDYLTDVGAAAAADREGSEIFGAAHAADRPGSEIGEELRNGGYIAKHGPSEIGADALRNGGYIAKYGPSEIGFDGRNGGYIAKHGPSEIGGGNPVMEAGEVEPTLTPFDTFMAEPIRMGNMDEVGNVDDVGFHDDDFEGVDRDYLTDVGAAAAADRPGSEIFGASPAAAVAKVIEKARDNRQPAPPMRAVDVDAPLEEDDWSLADTVLGAAAATGADPFPLLSQLLLRAGAATEPRYVRVDTEESYKAFRTEHSPELADLAARLDAHVADPHAHGAGSISSGDDELSSDLSDDIDDLVHLGAEAQAAEDAKRVDLWMPKRFDGLVTAWKEGENVCASLTLPGADGEVRICTSLEPIRKCVAEMAQHAAESGVPAATVVGVLPAMGCVLGAGTALKEMAAAAPAILQRPEAAGNQPFVVRIEPKTSPTLAALAMLAWACKQGNAQACDEWQKLGETCTGPVKQAMMEALQVVKAAA
jgi:hypothetical protein